MMKKPKPGKARTRVGQFTQRLINKGKEALKLYDANFSGPVSFRRQIGSICRGSKLPIIVGPWLSEVGFEILYWVPLLRHIMKRYKVNPKRVIALSRGGAGSWYSEFASRYVDIFDLCPPEEFVAENAAREEAQRGFKKQIDVHPFEERLIKEAAARLGIAEYVVFHPSCMYRYFMHVWRGMRPVKHVLRWCDHHPFEQRYGRPELPFAGDYYAMKFYYSGCFPETAENARFVRTLLSRVAATSNVVLLNTGLKLDDHNDSMAVDLPNVFDASSLMTPRTNLEVQSAIVAHSKGLLATYGGFSYLGPLLGVRSLSFYSVTKFIMAHLDIANAVLNAGEGGGFAALPAWSLDLVYETLSADSEPPIPRTAGKAAQG